MIPLTLHFAEPGSVEHSNSKPRLFEGPEGQVACITDAEKSLVFPTLQWKGKDQHFPRRIKSLTGKIITQRGIQLGAMTFHKNVDLNLFKSLNSVQALEICTIKPEQ